MIRFYEPKVKFFTAQFNGLIRRELTCIRSLVYYTPFRFLHRCIIEHFRRRAGTRAATTPVYLRARARGDFIHAVRVALVKSVLHFYARSIQIFMHRLIIVDSCMIYSTCS